MIATYPQTKIHDRRKSAGGRRTLSFGGAKRQVVVYEKDVPADGLDDCDYEDDADDVDRSKDVTATRIEIRLKGK